MPREVDVKLKFVLDIVKSLNITEHDFWLVEIARLLSAWPLSVGQNPLRRSEINDLEFQSQVNDRLKSNGIAIEFELSDHRRVICDHKAWCITQLLNALKQAKSGREVRIIYLVVLWELRRSELDLGPTNDTPYCRSDWGDVGT